MKRKNKVNRLLGILISLTLVFALLPSAALASAPVEIDLSTLSDSADGYTFDPDSKVLTLSGGYDYKISGATTQIRIIVPSGITADITLDGASLSSSACAFDMSGATVNLTLENDNQISSGGNFAGILVSETAWLTISAASTGSLQVRGNMGAGIGVSRGNGDTCGRVEILGGTIKAVSDFGCAIGGAYNDGNGGQVLISGENTHVTTDVTNAPAAFGTDIGACRLVSCLPGTLEVRDGARWTVDGWGVRLPGAYANCTIDGSKAQYTDADSTSHNIWGVYDADAHQLLLSTLSASPLSLNGGGSVSLQATITQYLPAYQPAGTISFYDGEDVIASNVALVDGIAQTDWNAGNGQHALRAVYLPAGETDNYRAEAALLTYDVNFAPEIGGGVSALADTIELTEGYADFSKVYTIAALPIPMVEMIADQNSAGASVTETGELTIPAGLTPGTYTANFAAENDQGTTVMKITVRVNKAAVPGMDDTGKTTAIPPTGDQDRSAAFAGILLGAGGLLLALVRQRKRQTGTIR